VLSLLTLGIEPNIRKNKEKHGSVAYVPVQVFISILTLEIDVSNIKRDGVTSILTLGIEPNIKRGALFSITTSGVT